MAGNDGLQVRWDSPVAMVGGRHGDKIAKTGIETVGDLISTYPRQHVQKGSLSQLDDLVQGDLLSFVGQVASTRQFTYQDKRTGRTAYRLEVRVRAAEGSLLLTYFDKSQHTAAWRLTTELPGRPGRRLQRQAQVVPRGVAADQPGVPALRGGRGRGRHDARPDPDLLLDRGHHHLAARGDDRARARPGRPGPGGAAPRGVESEKLVTARQALHWIHRPDTWAQKASAEKRLKYDEAFVAQTVLARRRVAVEGTVANPRPGRPGGILDAFDARLPFALTDGQKRVGEEIADELGRGHPMQRLLQGEVGSGKTVVSLRAMLQVVDSGGQAALLAPTEVLAQQHLARSPRCSATSPRAGSSAAPSRRPGSRC